MISPLLVKLFDLILKRQISEWFEENNQRAKDKQGSIINMLQLITLPPLELFMQIVKTKNKLLFVVSLIQSLTLCLEPSCGKDWKKLVSH
jgi:hypothetical protein